MLLRVFVALAAAVALCAQNQAVGRGVNFYSIEKEKVLGAQLAEEFRRQHPLLDSAAVHDYIEQMGARLVRGLPQSSPFPYQFEPTSDSTGTFLEPASLPGGYVFIPAGLILAANDESEVAGTLAHAMAHILARHYTREATKADIAQQQGGAPLIFTMDVFGYGADQAALLPVGFLQSQRGFESEADRLAVNIAATAGYDPEGLARYIGRTQQDPAQGRQFSRFSPRDTRVRAIEQAIQKLPAQSYPASGDFARMQDEVRRVLPPPAPKPANAPSLQRQPQ
jgi:beta-barrel assembly-enhancing protease